VTLKNKLAKGGLWRSLGGWSSQLFSLLIFIVLARPLHPEDFGLMADVGIFTAAARASIDPGFSQAIVNMKKLDNVVTPTAFWASTFIASLSSASVCHVASLLPLNITRRRACRLRHRENRAWYILCLRNNNKSLAEWLLCTTRSKAYRFPVAIGVTIPPAASFPL